MCSLLWLAAAPNHAAALVIPLMPWDSLTTFLQPLIKSENSKARLKGLAQVLVMVYDERGFMGWESALMPQHSPWLLKKR